jgi:hypothetical protein
MEKLCKVKSPQDEISPLIHLQFSSEMLCTDKLEIGPMHIALFNW